MKYILTLLLVLLTGIGVFIMYENTQLSMRIAELEGDPTLIKDKPWVKKSDLGQTQATLQQQLDEIESQVADSLSTITASVTKLQDKTETMRQDIITLENKTAVSLKSFTDGGNDTTPSREVDTESAPDTDGLSQIQVAVYIADDQQCDNPRIELRQIEVPATMTPLRESLLRLIAGEGTGAGTGTPFPLSGLSLDSLSLNNKVALIKLPAAPFAALDDCGRSFAEKMIRATATQFDGVRSVQIVDSSTNDYIFE